MKNKLEKFGKYTLLEKLAAGGMAEIFLAYASGVGGIRKFLAIKRILPQFSDNPNYKDMFTSEAKIAVNLSHNNVVSIYEFGIESKQLFLVMDYVSGRNLRQVLNKIKKKSVRLSLDQIVYIVKEVAAGLDHAHRCIDGSTGQALHIIHRDMSPQNIMISFEGEVKIVDFGIAKIGTQSESTPDGTLKGKFGYMSPEQAYGKEVDTKTDLFSLGIILWELLANERLFLANNEINTIQRIRACQVPNLRKINPNLPADIERAVNKLLAKDKNLRYQSADNLHRDLNRFLNKRFPDFSPQDFSQFMKSLYTKEILDTRKRLVEYAKMVCSNDNTEDITMLLNPEEDQLLETLPTKSSTIPSISLSDPSLERINLQTKTLDEKPMHLAESNNNLANSQVMLSSESGIQQNISKQSKLRRYIRRQQRTRLFIALVAIFVIAAVVYKTNVYQATSSSIKRILGHLPPALKQDKSLKKVYTLRTPDTTSTVPLPNQQETPTPSTSTQVNKLLINISSNPSGAKIFINGESTGKSTPSQMFFTQNKSLTIELKKVGYTTYKKENMTFTSSSQAFEANLKKALIGYLDIDARPPDPSVRIYINGQYIKKPLPILKHSVNADILIIEARNPVTKAYEKKRILLQPNQRRTIIFKLRPRKSTDSHPIHSREF